MPKITELWCWVAEDASPDDEGIPAVSVQGVMLPLIGADEDRLRSLREIAARLAKQHGKSLRLYRFSGTRELVDEVKP